MIYVIAPNFREAQYWAEHHSDPPLEPTEWTFVMDIHRLYGQYNITIVHYDVEGYYSQSAREMIREVYLTYEVRNWTIKKARNQ